MVDLDLPELVRAAGCTSDVRNQIKRVNARFEQPETKRTVKAVGHIALHIDDIDPDLVIPLL